MSGTHSQPSVPQPELLQLKQDYPTPSTTPQKRKHSPVTDDNGHEQQASAMAQNDIQDPAFQLVTEPHRNYGVYMHAGPNDSTVKEPQLVTISTDFNTAYNSMRAHARGQIDTQPKWGATREVVLDNVYEIIDSGHIVLLRYDIDAVFSAGIDGKDATIWMRERDWLAQNYPNNPPVRYGMYIVQNCDDESSAEQFFVGGFKSLGEANQAMKTSAHAYLQVDSEVKLMERCVELVGGKGEVRQRYVIEKGRWEDGGFVKEEEWLRQAANVPDGKLAPSPPKPISDYDTEATATKPVLRLNLPTSSSLVPQAVQDPMQEPAPSHQPRQPPQPKVTITDSIPWCTCRQPDNGGLMVLCENEDCPIQWFHGKCVDFDPQLGAEEKWYCPQCAPGREMVVAKKKGRARKKRKVN